MKSPFLVAAQMRASVEESNGSNIGREYNQDSTFSSSSSSSLSSSTSSLDGSAASSSSRSSTTPSSKKAAARAATPSTSRKKQRKTRDKDTNASEGLHMSMPDLDQLPGSLQLSPNPRAAPTIPALQKDFRTTSTSKIEKNERTAEESTMPVIRRSRADTRAMREAIKLKKAKRWSNCILVTSALPIAVALIADYLHPATARLSSEHTHQASWHLSTLASKCLHLSYQVPSGTSAVMKLIHLTTPQSLSPSNSASTLSILSNAISTAPTAERYLKGLEDVYIVLMWIAIWTFFRESVIRFVCGPMGRFGGIKRTSALQRFGEQGYDVVSHLIAVVFGLSIMQNQESGYRNMNMDGLWEGYPHYKLPANLKMYYLIQMGFWLQQVLTLHLEKRRKDYGQMFLHHIITVSLLYLSYIYNFTRIGNVILVLMDFSDILLGTAKMLKYLGFHENICNIAFGSFMLSWIITRHYLYPKVLYSVIFDSSRILKRFDWDPEGEWYYSRNTKVFFIVLLTALQVLLILWFFMIVKVALGVLCGKPAGDLRSDDEDESEVTATDELASGTSSPKRLQNIKMNGSSSSLDGSTSSIPNMPNGHLHGMSNGKVRQRARKQQQQ